MTNDPNALRRREFGAFLRSRRERLTPADVGLGAGTRRRTPGLRREEVALLAGVGATWYTWLEQGRDVRASAEVLGTLAQALKLDPAERRYLFQLGERAPPALTAPGPEQVPPPLLRMLDSMSGQPAYILGRRWDVLAWNRAAEVLFGDYARLTGDRRNAMSLLFTDPDHRRLIANWDCLAPLALAMFRADSARHAGDPDFARLIAALTAASPDFRDWWPRHEIKRPFTAGKQINHPRAGLMMFEYTTLVIADQPDLKFVVYTPSEQDNTVGVLAALLAEESSPLKAFA